MRKVCGQTGLKRHYGGKHRKGTLTEKHRDASGKNIRHCLKMLQELGLVGLQKYEQDGDDGYTMGKALTKKGITDMDRIASQLSGKGKK